MKSNADTLPNNPGSRTCPTTTTLSTARKVRAACPSFSSARIYIRLPNASTCFPTTATTTTHHCLKNLLSQQNLQQQQKKRNFLEQWRHQRWSFSWFWWFPCWRWQQLGFQLLRHLPQVLHPMPPPSLCPLLLLLSLFLHLAFSSNFPTTLWLFVTYIMCRGGGCVLCFVLHFFFQLNLRSGWLVTTLLWVEGFFFFEDALNWRFGVREEEK